MSKADEYAKACADTAKMSKDFRVFRSYSKVVAMISDDGKLLLLDDSPSLTPDEALELARYLIKTWGEKIETTKTEIINDNFKFENGDIFILDEKNGIVTGYKA